MELVGSDGSFVIGRASGEIVRRRAGGEVEPLGFTETPLATTFDGEKVLTEQFVWSAAGVQPPMEIPGLGAALQAEDFRDVVITDFSADGSTFLGFGDAVFAPYPEIRSTVGFHWNEARGLSLLYDFDAGDVGGGAYPEFLVGDGTEIVGSIGLRLRDGPDEYFVTKWDLDDGGDPFLTYEELLNGSDQFWSSLDDVADDGTTTAVRRVFRVSNSHGLPRGPDLLGDVDPVAAAGIAALREAVSDLDGPTCCDFGRTILSGDGLTQAYPIDGQTFLAAPSNAGFLADLLFDEFALQEAEGWHSFEVADISFDGSTIVGNGINPAGAQEAWALTLTPVPEPSSAGLLALLACGAVHRWRRTGSREAT